MSGDLKGRSRRDDKLIGDDGWREGKKAGAYVDKKLWKMLISMS
jgi:hypothetical protein